MSDFEPDTMLVHEVVPSPNHGERANRRQPDMILLHYTGMPDAGQALRWLCSPESEVSCHYFVREDGHIVQCVPEARRAWHAGKGVWAGETDINSCSIGIEIANPGHDHGYPDFPRRQIAAVSALCRGIILRRQIRPERVLAHSDIAPSRKKDPGEKFPWMALHRSGVGLCVKPAPLTPGRVFEFGDSGDQVENVQATLRTYGYGVEVDGYFDQTLREVVTAFQRHFRPALCDGRVDVSTRATLDALIAASRFASPPQRGDDTDAPAQET